MNVNNWKIEMQQWLEMFEQESTQSLRKIKRCFGASGRPFDENFRQYLWKMLTLRLDTSFNTVRFEQMNENPMQMALHSPAPVRGTEISSSTNISRNAEDNSVDYLNASHNENSIVVKIETDDDAPIAAADINDEDVDGQQLQVANDTIGGEIDSNASPELIDGNKNSDEECSGADLNTENGIDVDVKREIKVETEIEIEVVDLPLVAFDPTKNIYGVMELYNSNGTESNTNNSSLAAYGVGSLYASRTENTVELKIENNNADDATIEIVDSDDEDGGQSSTQPAASDTNELQIVSNASQESNDGAHNFDGEHINIDVDNENGLEIASKHEPKVENEIEMEDLPFAVFDPNNVNDSSGAMNDSASASELLENQSRPSSSMNEQNLPNSKRYIGKIYKCNSCAYTDRYKSNFQRHQLIHEGVKPFKCDHCGYAFRQKIHLKKHQQTHDRQKLLGVVQDSDDGLLKCTHCEQKFIKWENLTVHLEKFHKNNQRLFNCQRCTRPFTQITERDRHEIRCQKHRYECHLCKKYVGFYLSQIQRHMRTHSSAKPFQCEVCNRRFRQKHSLKYHLDSFHSRRTSAYTYKHKNPFNKI